MLRPFAAPKSAPSRDVAREILPSISEFLDELPSIEDFVDYTPAELPPITDFVADNFTTSAAPAQDSGDWFHEEQYDSEGWALTGWQNFDWNGAASLSARNQATDEANSAWDALDWNVPDRIPLAQSQADSTSASADEVARALDAIARRIRSGELVIDQLSGTPPEAAMAAALAAMLRMRD